jgi:hypothetical protein
MLGLLLLSKTASPYTGQEEASTSLFLIRSHNRANVGSCSTPKRNSPPPILKTLPAQSPSC